MLKILIPTDFSSNALKALDYAVTVFGKNASYTLLNAFEVPHSGATMLISIADILEKDSMQLLDDVFAKVVQKYPDMAERFDMRAEVGTPAVAVKKLTKNGEYDLVVMGTKGASGLKEVMVGSVTANLMAEVNCTVIAVPEDAKLIVPKKIVYAVDDQGLAEGKVPTHLADLASALDAEVMILNVVPKGGMAHVGTSSDSKAEPIGVFKNVKHSVHFIEDDDVNRGIRTFIEANGGDMLAMKTRRNDLYSKMFGTSNTKQMMMHTQIPLAAFH